MSPPRALGAVSTRRTEVQRARREKLREKLKRTREMYGTARNIRLPRQILRHLCEETQKLERTLGMKKITVYESDPSTSSCASSSEERFEESIEMLDVQVETVTCHSSSSSGSVAADLDLSLANSLVNSSRRCEDISFASGASSIPHIRVPFLATKFTEDEIWACLLATKISRAISDKTLICFGLLFNLLTDSHSDLPATQWRVSTRMDSMIPIKGTYAAFCSDCAVIVKTSTSRIRTAECDLCKKQLDEELRTGNFLFVMYSIREQLTCYLRNPTLPRLIRNYRKEYATVIGNREPHATILKAGDFSLFLFCDAAPVTKRSGVSLFPAIIFLNNIPVGSQCRFPMLAALFCGKSAKPATSILLDAMHQELLDLSQNPIEWVDDLGTQHSSRVYLPLVLTDAKGKSKILNQNDGGFGSCPYCDEDGVTVSRENFADDFRTSEFHHHLKETTTGKLRGVKFPLPFHLSSARLRTDSDRIKIGVKVLKQKIELEKADVSIKGIRGLPALYNLPYFRDNWSHVSDSLHVICEGLVKKLLGFMTEQRGSSAHKFCKNHADKKELEYFKAIQDSVHRVSELDHKTKYLHEIAFWTALDYMNFLLTEVSLVCSDEDIIWDTQFYEVWVRLANVTYLLHHGRLDESRLARLNEEMRIFSELYVKHFKAANCTWKFHVFQHFPYLAELHGPAYLWDGFNAERALGFIRKDVTATRNHVFQASRNFLLRFQALPLQKTGRFHDDCKRYLKHLGINAEDASLAEYRVEPIAFDSSSVDKIPDVHWEVLSHCFEQSLCLSARKIGKLAKMRVTRLRRCHQTITSAAYKGPAGALVNDSYIQIAEDEENFGEVLEIVWIPSRRAAFLLMQKFKCIHIPTKVSKHIPVEFPINQFPVCRTQELKAFRVTKDTFVQKILISKLRYKRFSRNFDFFSIRPNSSFRF